MVFTEADSDLICQPGARWMDINETLKKKGIPLFFPVCPTYSYVVRSISIYDLQIDPAPGATIGGMISTGCSGSMFHDTML